MVQEICLMTFYAVKLINGFYSVTRSDYIINGLSFATLKFAYQRPQHVEKLKNNWCEVLFVFYIDIEHIVMKSCKTNKLFLSLDSFVCLTA